VAVRLASSYANAVLTCFESLLKVYWYSGWRRVRSSQIRPIPVNANRAYVRYEPFFEIINVI